jgi:urocanate hydratase
MADNHIDFKYSLRTRYHGAHVLIMVWSFPLGLCFRKTGGFTKNRYHRLPSARRNGKTAPIEIQQQMQDNIQWIKGAQENKLVVGSSENSLCRCRRPCENCFRF